MLEKDEGNEDPRFLTCAFSKMEVSFMEMGKTIGGAEIFVIFVCLFSRENTVKLHFNFEMFREDIQVGI